MDASTFVILAIAGMVAIWITYHIGQESRKAGESMLKKISEVFVGLLVVGMLMIIVLVAWEYVMTPHPPDD